MVEIDIYLYTFTSEIHMYHIWQCSFPNPKCVCVCIYTYTHRDRFGFEYRFYIQDNETWRACQVDNWIAKEASGFPMGLSS